ncbi:MAG: VCBS repeat-containing protein, partial [Bacteroidetes bacterium]|nr:VCBS repeat-containing protein [Bacteroidota bacterium]
KYGSVRKISFHQNGKLKEDTAKLFDGLQRPVQVLQADIKRDGKEDYVVCEFGFLTGALSWMENKGNGKFIRHVLRSLPGAIKCYISDENNDGLPDLWVLFAQGEEGVFLFTNQGNGNFSQKELIRFPPVYGSSYFELDDFNNDGFKDILYTCGDNADYSAILKPYHGVYIFLNDGKNNFQQKYFFPVNGCYKAVAKDFDNDGDLDIASIAHFADYQRQPEEGFVYFENKGNFDFVPQSLPAAQNGRWLTMDAGDFDQDGYTDLLLGNFSIAPSFIKSKVDWKNAPPFLLLKNKGKKK